MFFLEPPITYTGTPLKAVVGDFFVATDLADDIPVTRLEVQIFLAKFRCYSLIDMKSKGVDFHLDFHGNEDTTFIGESFLIYNLLEEMRKNSMDAGATLFKIDVHGDDDRIRFVVADNGSGLHPECETLILRESFTQKSMASGLSLWVAAVNIRKMAGVVEYLGSGLDGVGASFSITLLREMPSE